VASVVQSIWDTVSGIKRDDPEVMQQASQFVSWSSHPYHKVFLEWLYREADKPVPIKDKQVDLIVGTARANTFKEIRAYLLDQEAKAGRLLDRENHG
jgi:hypothetical protein